MVRTIPCQHCKKRRRRCERPHEDEPCFRCRKMDVKCIRQDESSEYSSGEDDPMISDGEDSDNKRLGIMYQQVELLEREIGRLQIDINEQRKAAMIMNKHQHNNHHSLRRIKEEQIEGGEEGKQVEPKWNILVNDKEIRLLTKIETIEELILYSQSFMRYLSPFGNTFQGKSLVFERIHPSVFEVALDLTRQLQKSTISSKESNKLLTNHHLLNDSFDYNIQTESLVDQFIDNYFTCINTLAPLIHEPTYRLHYKQLKRGPLKDAVTMAICCHTAISVCPHSLHTSHQKRSMAEYFYSKCMDIVLDIYDDPNYALEALVCLNLLSQFTFVTLMTETAKRWLAISISLSAMLKNEIETEETIKTKNNTNNNNNNPDHTVRQEMIKRHCVVAEILHNLMEFTFHQRDLVFKPTFSYFGILPDEPEVTKSSIDMVNHIFNLATHPCTIQIEQQLRQLILGNVAEISFEEILEHEELIVDWWHNLPSDLKMTKEPFNCTKDLIMEETDVRKLIMCCHIHSFALNIQTSLIQPKLNPSTQNISSIVRERAIYLTVYAAEIVLAAAKRLSTLPNFCISPIKFTLRSIDSLISILKNTGDASIPNKAREKLKECMNELQGAVSIDHQVPTHMSPYLFYSISSDPVLTRQLYSKFPYPLEAIMYDITQNMVKNEL